MGDHQNHDLTWMIWGVPPWLRKFHVYHCISLWYSIYVPLSFHSTHFGIVPRLAVLKIHRRWFHPWHFRGFQVFKLPSKSTSTMIIHEQSQLPTKKKHVFNHLQPFNPVHQSKQHINAWRSWPSPAVSQGLAAACAASSALPVHWEDVVERIFVLEQPPVTISFKPNCSNDWMIWGYPHFGKAPFEERGRVF